MTLLSRNSCDIITLLPMGVECESIDASTPISSNGLINIFVTGGTPPYTTTWSNGSQGSSLYNLSPGSYTATTIDYFGDFTATTICTVGSSTFYLEQFQNCTNSAQTIYYVATATTTFQLNKVYRLNVSAPINPTPVTGCWISKGQTLYTGQTYNSSVATPLAGPFSSCKACSVEPLTPITPPTNLCMRVTQTSKDISTLDYIPFTISSNINGEPSWTSSTEPFIIYYNSGATNWNVSGWTFNGVPSQNISIYSPVGTWNVFGSSTTTLTIYSGNGFCVVEPGISLKTTDASCDGFQDGSVQINTYSGTAPFLYSLDGVTYGSTNMFLGLANGNYTAYMKDSTDQVVSQNFTISTNNTPIIYSLNFAESPAAVVTTNFITKSTQSTNTIQLTITPPLPSNKVVTFNLLHSTTYQKNSGRKNNTTVVPTLDYTFSTGATIGVQITGTSLPGLITNTTPNPSCPLTNEFTTGTSIQYKTVFSGSNTTLTLNLNKKITTPDADEDGCTTYGLIRDTFQVTNPRVLNQSSCETFDLNKSITVETDRNGFKVINQLTKK